MARRGSFGRQPRSAPSLTNTLVAIAREMQNQRDQNLMDAWKNGGLFEGAKATDEMVLAHWKERLAGVSKDDPLYDSYNNAYMQYDYSIHESKATLANAQGKMSDAALAGFYSGWAKKVPKDSEFYRVLQRDAAQWMRAAKAKHAGNTQAAKEKAYRSWQDTQHTKGEAGMEYMVNGLREMARTGVAGLHTTTMFSGSQNDFGDFDPGDPEQMLTMLSRIAPKTGATHVAGEDGGRTTGGSYVPSGEVLFLDQNGKGVTGVDFIAQLHKLDPHFDGNLTPAYIASQIDGANRSIQERITYAVKTGHQTEAEQLRKSQTYIQSIGTLAKTWEPHTDYVHATDAYLAVVEDPTSSAEDKQKAYDNNIRSLQTILADPRTASDLAMRAALQGEIDGKSGTPSVAELMSKPPGGKNDPMTSGDWIAKKVHKNEIYSANIDALNLPPEDPRKMYVTQGIYDPETGDFKPQSGGQVRGEATMSEITDSSPNQPQSLLVPNKSGGGFTTMWVTGVDVRAAAVDANGKDIPLTQVNSIATMYRVNVGGVPTQTYKYQKDGKLYLGIVPPWDESRVHARVNAKGNVDLILDPKYVAEAMSVPHTEGDGSGWYLKGKTKTNPGEWVIDPALVVFNSDPSRQHGGADPFVDFGGNSLTAATLSQTPDGREMLSKSDSNPELRDRLKDDFYTSAGFSRITDPKTGATVGYDGQGNQDEVALGMAQAKAWALPSDKRADVLGPFFDRTKTHAPSGSTYKEPLATDTLRASDNTFTAQFSSLANSFTLGTNLIPKGGTGGLNEPNMLRMKGQLTLPSISTRLQEPQPAFTSPSMSTYTPPSTPTPGPAPTSFYTPPQSDTSKGYSPPNYGNAPKGTK